MLTQTQEKQAVIIKFAGDSGDGMQLTGGLFTDDTAISGSDLATFPDFPAEIRAPRGTRAGVSGFQVQFAAHEVHTPGDTLDALVALNPAALVTNLNDLRKGGLLIVNEDSFAHNVFSLSPAKSFDLGSFGNGGSKIVTFDKPGKVEVECAVHPDMLLAIEVTP